MNFPTLLFVGSILGMSSARMLITNVRVTCNKTPVPDLAVEFWEDDVISDDFLIQTYTNVNGTAKSSVHEEDGVFDGHMEPIVKVHSFECPEGEKNTTCEWFHVDSNTEDGFLENGDRHVVFRLDFPAVCES